MAQTLAREPTRQRADECAGEGHGEEDGEGQRLQGEEVAPSTGHRSSLGIRPLRRELRHLEGRLFRRRHPGRIRR